MANKPLGRFRVEVVFARPGQVWIRQVEVSHGATAMHAVQLSGVLDAHPELNGVVPPIGIFGRLCPPEQRLQAGDRVELYRPLVFDPMESRRRRMAHREKEEAAGSGRVRRSTVPRRRKTGPR